MSERNARLLAGLATADRLVEIGPSFNPIAPKAAGWDVTIVDHASQEDLVTKYTGHPGVDTARIEAVDVIWRGGPLHEALPPERHGTYSALIASHVIEHLPDLVGFLRSAEQLLDPVRGALLLAVPDKRFCFDIFRPVSTTGQFLAAHRQGRSRHSAAAMFDHLAYSALDNHRLGWGREPVRQLRLAHRLDEALQQFDLASEAGEYADCHGWQYTPASFELLILEVAGLGFIDWQVEWLEPQPAVEFLVRLRRGRQAFPSVEAREARRLELLKCMVLELREMVDCLDEPSAVPMRSPAQPAPAGTEARLDAMEARLRSIGDVQLPAIAASLGAVQEAFRPIHSALEALLPVRRAIARVRRRG